MLAFYPVLIPERRSIAYSLPARRAAELMNLNIIIQKCNSANAQSRFEDPEALQTVNLDLSSQRALFRMDSYNIDLHSPATGQPG